MRKKQRKKATNFHLPSYPIIKAATTGDIDAINLVLKHYEPYIITLSTRPLYDEKGKAYLFYDEELRRMLETKLISKILKFSIA